jgi:hypothetical protein
VTSHLWQAAYRQMLQARFYAWHAMQKELLGKFAIHENATIYMRFSIPCEVIAEYHNKNGFATQSQINFRHKSVS